MMKKMTSDEALAQALSCPCGDCDGAPEIVEVSRNQGKTKLGSAIACEQGELQSEPDHNLRITLEAWNSMVEEYKAKGLTPADLDIPKF